MKAINVTEYPTNKIMYISILGFKSKISPRRWLELANRIDRRNVGAACVEGNFLHVAATLSFEGRILVENIVTTVRQFRELLEDTVFDVVRGELDYWG